MLASFDATVSHDSAGMVHMSEADRLAATDANLSLETAFRSGWKLYARHWCTLTGATLFVILVASVFGLTTVAGADGLGPLVIPVGLCFLAGIFMLLSTLAFWVGLMWSPHPIPLAMCFIYLSAPPPSLSPLAPLLCV